MRYIQLLWPAGEDKMIYFHKDREYLILIPTIAVSLEDEFWIEIDWLNIIIGWRSGKGKL